MSYHQFISEDGSEYGSFEVFHSSLHVVDCWEGMDEREMPPGWYWQACSPGCLPDGDAYGPFDSEDEAIADANATSG